MAFPFFLADSEVLPADFDLLAGHFAKTVTEFLPCRQVRFVSAAEEGRAACPAQWLAGVEQVLEKRQPLLDLSSDHFLLYLPVWNGSGPVGVAVLLDGEPALRETSLSWLLERSQLVSREFQLLKQAFTDPVTGLLNGTRLHGRLELLLAAADGHEVPAGSDCVLGLLEINGKPGGQGLVCLSRVGTVLASLLQQEGTVHHLGGGVFGLLWEGLAGSEATDFGAAFLRRLKREGYARARLGMTVFRTGERFAAGGGAGVLFDRAWSALQTARKRGPFGISLHGHRGSAGIFDRSALPPPALSELRRHWRGCDCFSLVLLETAAAGGVGALSDKLTRPGRLDRSCLIPVNDRQALVFFPGAGPGDSFAWAGELQRELEQTEGPSCAIGIAAFPCSGFSRSAMVDCAGKALHHALFFGPAGLALFDGVSLNISGDVYYNDGDLRSAIREYRQGLALDPANRNLLNSLGVAYGELNRYQEAIPCFEKVLATDRRDFMALYNIGFAYLQTGRKDEALRCFEMAREVDSRHFELLLQLGRLYCDTGEYEKAVAAFSAVIGQHDDSAGKGYGWTVRHYLGLACRALGRNQEAISAFEQAIGKNPRDAASLSMLGELYALEKEGDEIALALCRQAVELEETSWENWYRLGQVQMMQGNNEAACQSLRRSLLINRKGEAAALLLARLCGQNGTGRQVRRGFAPLPQRPLGQGAGRQRDGSGPLSRATDRW